MERIDVELTGTSPILMNACVAKHEALGEWPKTDREAAERKLYRTTAGGLFLPRRILLRAITREGRKHRPDLAWPTRINALEAWEAANVDFGVEFIPGGDWTVYANEMPTLRYWVYPCFDAWAVRFTLAVDPTRFDPHLIRDLIKDAGYGDGLPQYTPFVQGGEWGRFVVSKWQPVETRRLIATTA